MNRRLVIYLCLIVLTAGQVLGQEDLRTQLTKLEISFGTLAELIEGLATDIWPNFRILKTVLEDVKSGIGKLPVNSGTFLDNEDNRKLLQRVVELNAETNSQCLSILESRLAKLETEPDNVYVINELLSSLNQIVAEVTSSFQQKLSVWAMNRGGDLDLFGARRTLLRSLETMATEVCAMKKNTSDNDTRKLAQEVLDSLRSAAKNVDANSFDNHIVRQLVSLAREIDFKAMCL